MPEPAPVTIATLSPRPVSIRSRRSLTGVAQRRKYRLASAVIAARLSKLCGSMAATIPVRVSRAESVARELESEILAGVEPGTRIGTKDELRRRFGVAVATVNEAVRLLELRGLISVR